MSQGNWYTTLAKKLKNANPRPRTYEEVQTRVNKILAEHQNEHIKGLLDHYGISSTIEVSSTAVPTSLPDGVQFEWNSLPVDPRAIVDGDGMSVYVSVTDPEESSKVPLNILIAGVERLKLRALQEYERANSPLEEIKGDGYNVIHINNEEYLARKLRIRLRGIDAPEMEMPFGKEAKAELTNIVQHKCLKISVYNQDDYGRFVGDVYCGAIFVQKHMIRKGFAWHCLVRDQRPELKMWEKEARCEKAGLWALPNPEPPWEWRKKRRKKSS